MRFRKGFATFQFFLLHTVFTQWNIRKKTTTAWSKCFCTQPWKHLVKCTLTSLCTVCLQIFSMSASIVSDIHNLVQIMDTKISTGALDVQVNERPFNPLNKKNNKKSWWLSPLWAAQSQWSTYFWDCSTRCKWRAENERVVIRGHLKCNA